MFYMVVSLKIIQIHCLSLSHRTHFTHIRWVIFPRNEWKYFEYLRIELYNQFECDAQCSVYVKNRWTAESVYCEMMTSLCVIFHVVWWCDDEKYVINVEIRDLYAGILVKGKCIPVNDIISQLESWTANRRATMFFSREDYTKTHKIYRCCFWPLFLSRWSGLKVLCWIEWLY